MTFRITRRKTVSITRLPKGFLLKLQMRPWIYTDEGVVWIASFAVGKSTRQINDWMKERKNRRTRRMATSLTGKEGNKTQAIAIRQVRDWVEQLPIGDSLTLRCESKLSEKQFRVWKKWFTNHENSAWEISDEHKAFFFYKDK